MVFYFRAVLWSSLVYVFPHESSWVHLSFSPICAILRMNQEENERYYSFSPTPKGLAELQGLSS